MHCIKNTLFNFCSDLHHPNIVNIMGVIESKAAVTIIMTLSFVEGQSLHLLIFESIHPRVRNVVELSFCIVDTLYN